MAVPPRADEGRLRVPGAAFLLSQVGFHSASLWRERLAPLGLDPLVMLLRHVAAEEGRSQQALGEALQIPPSRMVALVDDLEQRGLVERQANPTDRRARALHLTREGRRVLAKVMELSAAHKARLSAGLEQGERRGLIALLSRIAAEQGLAAGVHPGVAYPGTEKRRRRLDRGTMNDAHKKKMETRQPMAPGPTAKPSSRRVPAWRSRLRLSHKCTGGFPRAPLSSTTRRAPGARGFCPPSLASPRCGRGRRGRDPIPRGAITTRVWRTLPSWGPPYLPYRHLPPSRGTLLP